MLNNLRILKYKCINSTVTYTSLICLIQVKGKNVEGIVKNEQICVQICFLIMYIIFYQNYIFFWYLIYIMMKIVHEKLRLSFNNTFQSIFKLCSQTCTKKAYLTGDNYE